MAPVSLFSASLTKRKGKQQKIISSISFRSLWAEKSTRGWLPRLPAWGPSVPRVSRAPGARQGSALCWTPWCVRFACASGVTTLVAFPSRNQSDICHVTDGKTDATVRPGGTLTCSWGLGEPASLPQLCTLRKEIRLTRPLRNYSTLGK